MEKDKHVGYELRQTDNVICRFAEHRRTMAGYGDLTFSQSAIIHYLFRHQDHPVYQKDLEKRFDIRRSTVTGILQNLEKNGYITRSNDTQDARMKQICLTDKAKNAEDTFHSMAEEDEALITKDFSAEEILILTSLLEKIRHNIEQEEAL